MAAAINLTAPNVNLAVSNATVAPTSLIAGNGASATVSWTITNDGSDTAAAVWTDGVYISNATTLNVSAVKLGEFSSGPDAYTSASLAPGATYSQSETVMIPNTSLLGSDNILIVADDSDTQAQSSTANNVAVVPVSVALPASLPDLQIAAGSVTAPSSATTGETIPVSWTVTNSGSGSALGTWTEEVYSSPTATFNAATAQDLGGFAAPTTLAAGAGYTQTQSVTLPAASASDNYILVVADNGQTQAESDYANNVGLSAAITISAPVLPSLAIAPSSFAAPASAALGQTIAVNWSVENTGSVATSSAWSDELYVSDNSTYRKINKLRHRQIGVLGIIVVHSHPQSARCRFSSAARYNEPVARLDMELVASSRMFTCIAELSVVTARR